MVPFPVVLLLSFTFLYASARVFHFLATLSGQKDCVKWLPNFFAASFHSCFLLALADLSHTFRSFRVYGRPFPSVSICCCIRLIKNRVWSLLKPSFAGIFWNKTVPPYLQISVTDNCTLFQNIEVEF